MPKRKLVLVIGMIDSIHLAKWLSRFEAREIDFEVFPCQAAWNVHPILQTLLSKSGSANYKLLEPIPRSRSKKIKMLITKGRKSPLLTKSRIKKLRKILRNRKFDYIHIQEFQHSGYLFLNARQHFAGNPKIVLTNWGSDIYFYKKDPDHLIRIRELLEISDQYSAECVRDYMLAQELGFSGENLPAVPTSFDLSFLKNFPDSFPCLNQRKQLIIKAYGGKIGEGRIAIQVAAKFLEKFSNSEVLLYSLTSDLFDEANRLKQNYEGKVRIWKVIENHAHSELMTEFSRSRIYLGLSKSDGISTAFLEAIATGTYPIQSNTSCAGEMLIEGFQVDLPEVSAEQVWDLLQKRWDDLDRLGVSTRTNSKLISEKYSPEFFESRLQMYYR